MSVGVEHKKRSISTFFRLSAWRLCSQPRARTPSGQLSQSKEDDRSPSKRSVQHFWLWATCCEKYSLQYDEELGVTMNRHFERAAAPDRVS